MRQGRSASAAFGMLLDRSLVQIEAAAADGRAFDRETVRAVSDVWDNNTFPLFEVALARTRCGAERRARTALAWMAGFGAKRCAWMMAQLGEAGQRPESLLPACAEDAVPGRDYRGAVMARPFPLTEEAARNLAADYDVTGGDVRTLQVERAGVDRLVGFLGVEAGRRFPMSTDGVEPAMLELWLEEITEVRFDSGDSSPVTLDALPEGVVIGFGAGGFIRAKRATVYCDDSYWHLSAAGLASYTAAHTRYGRAREASSTFNLALPPGPQDAADKPWRLRSLKIDRARRFHLHTRAFDGPGDLRLDHEQDKVTSISLHGDALTVSAEPETC